MKMNEWMDGGTYCSYGGICGTWNMKETDRVKLNTIIRCNNNR